jgi:hypothetical protein
MSDSLAPEPWMNSAVPDEHAALVRRMLSRVHPPEARAELEEALLG